MLDAYQVEGVAPHLLTYDFYSECHALLGPHGLVVSNLHSSTQVYDAARRTFAAAFRHTTACSVPSGNVVVMGSDTLSLDPGLIRNRAALSERSQSKRPAACHLGEARLFPRSLPEEGGCSAGQSTFGVKRYPSISISITLSIRSLFHRLLPSSHVFSYNPCESNPTCP